MPHMNVKASWIAHLPSKRMDAKFWILVGKAMDELGINKETAGAQEIDQAIAHVKGKMETAAKQISDLRAKAETLRLKAKKIEIEQPDVQFHKVDEERLDEISKERVQKYERKARLQRSVAEYIATLRDGNSAAKMGSSNWIERKADDIVRKRTRGLENAVSKTMPNPGPYTKVPATTYESVLDRSITESTEFQHPHLRGEQEWFRWTFGAAWFNVDQAREMIANGQIDAKSHTVKVKDLYALLGLDQNEYGSKDFTNDMESGRGINPMSAITNRSHMQGMPEDKFIEPAIIAMVDGYDLMKRAGLRLGKDAKPTKESPMIIDGNHRLGRLFLEGAKTCTVYVVPYEEVLKFAYSRDQKPVLKPSKAKKA